MTHLTELELGALADGELTGWRSERAGRHLAQCGACAEAVARRRAQERELATLLRSVDHPPPPLAAERVMKRAARREPTKWRAVAAGLAGVTLAAAAAAAVIPGSPVRAFFGRHGGAASGARTSRQEPAWSTSSVGFAPTHVVNVAFQSAQRSGEIGVLLSDSLLVRVAHRAGSPSYTVTADGVLIANGGSGASYEVTVPRTVPVVRILVGNRVVFARDSGHVSGLASPDGPGRYRLQFAALAVSAR